jgi:hypothetical protein
MVHALRRAHGLVRPCGLVIDLHPTADPALVLVGDATVGVVDAGDGPARHQAATDAIAAALAAGLFELDETFEFDFYLHADTIDQLHDHIVEDWRDACIGDETLARARTMLEAWPDARPCVRERIRVSRLRRSERPDAARAEAGRVRNLPVVDHALGEV